MQQSTFGRQLIYAMFGTAIGVAVYVGVAPTMPPPLYAHADYAYLLYLFANFMMWWSIGAEKPQLAVGLHWLFYAHIVMLPAYFQIHEGFTWSADDQARNNHTVLGGLNIVMVSFIATAIGQILASSLLRPATARPAVRRTFRLLPLAVTILAGVVMALGLATYLGLGAFLMRRADLLQVGWTSGADRAIYFVFPRGLAAYGLVMYLIVIKDQILGERRLPLLWLIAIGAIILPINAVINFPLALPRFWFFGLILTVFFMFMPLRNIFLRTGFFVGFISLFMFVMPIADELTRGSGEADVTGDTFSTGAVYDYLISQDMQQLAMVMNVFYYTEQVGFTYGNQLASAVFFFIPRVLWPDKSLGTGWLAADEAGYDFLILSEPIAGEFFIDGGYPWMIIACMALGWFMVWLDRRFNRAVDEGDAPTRLWISVYLGMSIMIYRGALLGVVPPIAAFFLPVICACFFLTRTTPVREAVRPAGSEAPATDARPAVLARRWLPKAPTNGARPGSLGWSRPA